METAIRCSRNKRGCCAHGPLSIHFTRSSRLAKVLSSIVTTRRGAYQSKDTKRMRMSEEFNEDDLEMGGQPPQANIKGPPVRPSAAFKKVSAIFASLLSSETNS